MNTVDDLAHELWAIAQGRAPVSEVVDAMIPTLRAALSAEYERGRSERYTGTPTSDPDYEHSEAAQREQDAEPVAWDYYHKRLMGAPGETRHHIYWVSHYVGRDGKVTGDLEWLLDSARAGKEYVEAPIWVRPMYYSPPKRRPLTDDQIDAIKFDGFSEPTDRRWSEAECLRYFARLVERAHGIGDE